MRFFITLVLASSLASLWCTPVMAQDDDAYQAEMQTKFDQKMEKPFIAYGGWLTDYAQAREIAKQEGKLLFVYFTRSYAP